MATTSATNNSDEQTLTPTVFGGVTTEIAIEGGNTIPILHPAPPTLNTAFVDQTFDATFEIGGTDIHSNGTLVVMTDKQLDAGWSRVANVVTFAGLPLKVKGYVSISAPDGGASNYWARPKLRVIRGGNVIARIDDLVMQQNGAYNGDAMINGVFFDKAPGLNPAYTFEWYEEDARTATLPPRVESQIALEATLKVQVYTP